MRNVTKRVKGDILDGETVMAESLNVVLTESTSSTGMRSWLGTCALPSDATLVVGNSYELRLEDGRSGEVIVVGISADSGGGRIARLRGNGALE